MCDAVGMVRQCGAILIVLAARPRFSSTGYWNQHIAESIKLVINPSMIKLLLLLLTSAGVTLWSAMTFGPILTLPLLLGASGIVLAVILLLRSRFRKPINWVVVDGSNVLYWQNDEPTLHSVRLVIEQLVLAGFEPKLWFDANVGYLVAGRYMNPAQLSKALRYPARRISVAPKGTPADPLLISDAERLKARIVTNDRFRDWQERFPQVAQQDVFLRGRIKNKRVHLK